ncbi:MAG TPA: hypothetical protein EYG82_05235 [Sulfurovum sp.]|nr:hypothetical protein [Sulfurovum sp.]
MSFARGAGFEGMLVMIDDLEIYIYLESIYDDEMLGDIVYENGWEEECALIDFTADSQRIIHLEEAVA